jgi:hypothetical protein
MAVMDFMKGERALTAATVVTSLTEMKVDGVSDEQGPRAVIRAKLGLGELMPGLPPTAVRYTRVVLLQEYNDVILKVPSLPVVTVCVSKGVDAEPSAEVPTAYSWMVAPETGC